MSLDPRANLGGGTFGAKQLAEKRRDAAIALGLSELQGRLQAGAANKYSRLSSQNLDDAYYGRVMRCYEQLVSRSFSSKAPAHFDSRHGAQTTKEDQWKRATEKIIPGTNPPKFDRDYQHASRFLTNKDQYDVIKKAIFIRSTQINFNKITPENDIIVSMDRDIGEGYRAGGSSLIITRIAIVSFDDNGRPYTAYPDVRKKDR